MDELKKLNQKISDEIAGAREAGIRDTLVALGWVPPKESGQQSARLRELEGALVTGIRELSDEDSNDQFRLEVAGYLERALRNAKQEEQ